MKRFITAWLMTVSMLLSAFFMPFLMKKWLEFTQIDESNMFGFYCILFIVYIGYFIICIAAWVRAFKKEDDWFYKWFSY